jgi:hypothetical protein
MNGVAPGAGQAASIADWAGIRDSATFGRYPVERRQHNFCEETRNDL